MVYVSKRASSLKLGTSTVVPQQEIVNIPDKVNFNDLKEQWFSEILQITDDQIKSMLNPFLSSAGSVLTVVEDDAIVQGQNGLHESVQALQLETQVSKAEVQATKAEVQASKAEVDAISKKFEVLHFELKKEIGELKIMVEQSVANVNIIKPVVVEQRVVEPVENVIVQDLLIEVQELKSRIAELESNTPKRAPKRGTKKDAIQITI